MISDRRPAGLIALALFFAFGAVMSGLAALTLLIPYTALDSIWRLNPHGHRALLGLGSWGIGLMTLVSCGCGAACMGLLRGAAWGRALALTLLVMNLMGDAGNALYRGDVRTLLGLPIGAALIAYLLSRRVRGYFQRASRGVARVSDEG